MEMGTAVFVVLSSLLAIAAGLAAWWLHRQRLAALGRRLRDAEDSRMDLAATAAVLHRRLAAADQALLVRDQRERSQAMQQALAAAAPAQSGWQDTHPVTVPGRDFLPTQPAELG